MYASATAQLFHTKNRYFGSQTFFPHGRSNVESKYFFPQSQTELPKLTLMFIQRKLSSILLGASEFFFFKPSRYPYDFINKKVLLMYISAHIYS